MLELSELVAVRPEAEVRPFAPPASTVAAATDVDGPDTELLSECCDAQIGANGRSGMGGATDEATEELPATDRGGRGGGGSIRLATDVASAKTDSRGAEAMEGATDASGRGVTDLLTAVTPESAAILALCS